MANDQIQNPLPIPPGRPGRVSVNIGGLLIACMGPFVPIHGPGLIVPQGATVRVRGSFQGVDNSNPVTLGLSREGVIYGQGDPLNPGVEVIYPVDNLAQLWVSGFPGDGVSVSVRANG